MSRVTEWILKMTDGVTSPLSRITGQADSASARFAKLSERVDRAQNRFGMLKSVAAGALSVFSLVSFGNTAVRAFDEADQAAAQLRASLTSTAGVVGRTIEQLEGISVNLMGKTRFDDDLITKAQSILLTFTNIRGEIYDKAVPAIADLATKMGGDLNAAALQVGKALNDPIRGINALRRSGVSFSESQQAMVKKLVAGGNIIGAQTIILTELQRQFGGSAEAAARAGIGPLIMLKNQFMNNIEAVGKWIANGALWIIDNGPIIKDVLIGIGAGLTAVGTASLIANAKMLLLAAGTNIMTAAQAALNFAMTANPIGVIIVGIGALVAVMTVLWQRSERFRGFLYGLWASFKEVFLGISQLAKDTFGNIVDLINPMNWITSSGREKFSAALKNLDKPFKDFGNNVATKFNEGFAEGSSQVAEKLAKDKPGKKNVIASAGFTIPKNEELAGAVNSINGGGGKVNNFYITIQKLQDKTEITALTIKEGAAQAGDEMIANLTRAINGIMQLSR